jgi:hypothetical protein
MHLKIQEGTNLLNLLNHLFLYSNEKPKTRECEIRVTNDPCTLLVKNYWESYLLSNASKRNVLYTVQLITT